MPIFRFPLRAGSRCGCIRCLVLAGGPPDLFARSFDHERRRLVNDNEETSCCLVFSTLMTTTTTSLRAQPRCRSRCQV